MKEKETELDKKEIDIRKEDLEKRDERFERPEEPEELEEAEEEKGLQKGLQKKYIFIIPVALVFLIVAVLLAWFLFFVGKPTKERIEKADITETVKEETPLPEVILFSFEPFFIPLSGSGKEKDFLKFKISAELDSPELKREMNFKLPTLRNSITEMVMGKSKDYFKGPEGKEKIKKEMLKMLNFRLKSGKIKEIYFSQFMIQ